MAAPVFLHDDRSTWLLQSNKKPLSSVIAPSILSADFSDLYKNCLSVLTSPDENNNSFKTPEWLHCDVMDGVFVPNISFGFCVIQSLRKRLPHVFLDVHCMIQNPSSYVSSVSACGASQMTFHIEAVKDVNEAKKVASVIRAAGMQVGLALKPATGSPSHKDVEVLIEEGLIDMLLIMTVEPGFGGQGFMREMMEKVRYYRSRYPQLAIQVDGGVDGETVKEAAEAGANVMVAGTAIFKAPKPKEMVEKMRAIVNKSLQK